MSKLSLTIHASLPELLMTMIAISLPRSNPKSSSISRFASHPTMLLRSSPTRLGYSLSKTFAITSTVANALNSSFHASMAQIARTLKNTDFGRLTKILVSSPKSMILTPIQGDSKWPLLSK